MRVIRSHAQGDAWCSFLLWFLRANVVLGQMNGEGGQESSPSPEPTPSESPLAEPDNVPPTNQFLRRADSGAVVLGDYIYFDGGDVSQNNTGESRNPMNATLAIDLTKSWNTDDVDIIETEYGSNPKQSVMRQALLVNQSSDSFYAWGGEAFGTDSIRDLPELWRFEADGDGGGRWRNETPADDNDYFYTLKRSRSNAYVSTQDKGFIFGGVSTTSTTPEHQGPMGGYVTFDFKSKTWSHDTRAPYSPVNTMIGGGAVYAPDLGPRGLVFVFGGVTHIEDSYSREDMLNFSTIHFMDPETNRWYSQETFGTPPGVRTGFCTAAVASDNGTRFDIFIYGGVNPLEDVRYSDVHILSIPTFHWTPVPGATNAGRMRQRHSCAVVGRRHLLSWGGFSDDNSRTERDAFPQGIGLLDMTTLQWTTRYDADAEPYVQHQLIQDWVANNWDDYSMQGLSQETADVLRAGDNWPTPSRSRSSQEDSPPVGAIAGGVVGGVVVVAVIGALFWFLRRRRRRRAAKQQEPDVAATATPEMESTESQSSKPGFQYYPEMPDSGRSELPAGYLPPELVVDRDGPRYASEPRYEVDGTSVARPTNKY